MSHSRILFVPAWWPCSFFEEQQAIYSNDYDVYNLYGSITFWSKRKIVNQFLFGSVLHRISSIKKSTDSVEIRVNWRKRKSNKQSEKQLQKLSDKIGLIIIDLLGGELPDIIHIQSVSDVSALVVNWAKRSGIRVVLTEHVLYIRRNVDYFTRIKEKVFYLADHVYCVSNYLYRNLLTNGFKMNTVSIIGNLVSSYAVPCNWNEVRKNGRGMFVASHVNDKDVPLLMQVSERLKREGIGVDVYGLTGNEILDNEKSIEEVALEKGLGPFLCFKGPYSHKSLLELYSAYSVLLSTSVSETFGLSVAEAIAHGTPVVCTDSGGVRDYVDKKNGIVVAIRDVEGVVEALHIVLSQKYDYRSMSDNILKEYGIDNYRNKVLSHYDQSFNNNSFL